MASLSRVDHLWIDVVADMLARPAGELPVEEISRLLVDTFGAAGVTYYASAAPEDLAAFQRYPVAHYAPFEAEMRDWVPKWSATRHPLLRYFLTTGRWEGMQVSEVSSLVADRTVMGGWRELAHSWGGVTAQVALPIGVGPRGPTSVVMDRDGSFSVAEMTTARRLQRLLVGLHGQVTALSSRDRGTGPRASAGLTPRELAVLTLLADGLTAAAIGRRLAITERTVHKHLQNTYVKLGATDRLTAVRRAQMVGVLPTPWSTQF